MTDDKTDQVVSLTEVYGRAMAKLYANMMEDWDIPPEQACSMSCTAFIGARDTLYPRVSYRNTGGGGKSGGNYDNPTQVSEKFAWFIINKMRVALFEKFKSTDKVNEYVEACWLEKYPNKPFEEDVYKWTAGQARWITDKTEERHPELPIWKKEGK